MEFDLTVSLPREARYAATARLIAAEAAREAGANGAPAEAFATQVEDAARTSLSADTRSATLDHVVMAVHRQPNTLVVRIDQRTLTLTL